MNRRTSLNQARVQVRRIYETPMPNDGTRVLVDRLWPRGMSKARAQLDEEELSIPVDRGVSGDLRFG
ncbi:uncharacterized protein RMCC_0004 [Mycolicibacterium canariasense]|uniref:DUF488 family protein n=1 Tax=Mycolicibacterium canariasense TaxID=228230 RepID=A0A100W793_MYCCR|nr:DUF488 family protein [Mycolicibacterium canariasense]GAS93037.1 uncharacterized protein RMCC_0004 [Mycolicibacterium canariasense]